MEEKIYDRQVTKEAIALRVVDKKQIDRHFSNADLSELLVYTPAPPPQDMDGRERPEVGLQTHPLLLALVLITSFQLVQGEDLPSLHNYTQLWFGPT